MTTLSQKLQEKAQAEGKTQVPFLEVATQITDEEGNKKGVQGTGPHRVKFIRDKAVKGKDYNTKEERDEVEYLFLEGEIQKRYRKPVKNRDGNLHYFVAEMAKYNYGDELTLEYKKKSGSYEGYIDVRKSVETEPVQTAEEDIPVIEDDEQTTEEPKFKKVVPTTEGGEINADDIPF